MAHHQDTTLLDIHITSKLYRLCNYEIRIAHSSRHLEASCESSHLLNDHSYRLKLARDSFATVIGVQRTKSARSLSGSGKTSWEDPFEGRL